MTVQQVWSEQQMVCSFGGGMSPGTPDGMFEDITGSLTCVQVVRVPVLPGMSLKTFVDRVYDTVLTKVIKSQTWMKCTRRVPQNFVIFCWFMPRLRPRHLAAALQPARSLINRVAGGGWPFSLKVAVPDSAEDIFPDRFASQYSCHMNDISSRNIKDIVNFCVDVDSDDEPEWDIFSFEFDIEEEETESEHDERFDNEIEEIDAVQEDEDDAMLEAPQFELLVQFLASIFVSVAVFHLQELVVARQRESPLGDGKVDGLIQAWGATYGIGVLA
jgi:hypothetical protein